MGRQRAEAAPPARACVQHLYPFVFVWIVMHFWIEGKKLFDKFLELENVWITRYCCIWNNCLVMWTIILTNLYLLHHVGRGEQRDYDVMYCWSKHILSYNRCQYVPFTDKCALQYRWINKFYIYKIKLIHQLSDRTSCLKLGSEQPVLQFLVIHPAGWEQPPHGTPSGQEG